MKHIVSILIITLLLSSCLKDNGNYKYTAIAPVTIKGINDSYRVFLQSSLNIPVTIETTLKESDLEYNWMVGPDTLCRTKDFNYTFVDQSATSDALVLEVRNKTNNVRYTKRANLTIVSPFQTGWAILSEKNNKGYLSFLSYEGNKELFKDVYQQVNKESLGSNPISVKHLMDWDINRLSIICSGGKSVEIDGSNFKKVKYYQDEFKAPNFAPVAINVEKFSADRFFMIISGGKIYPNNIGSFPVFDDGWYEFPLDADALGYSVDGWYTKGPDIDQYMAFDQLNKRYVGFAKRSSITQVTSLPLNTGLTQMFNPNNVDGHCIWMGQSSASKALSIIKTTNGKYLLHVFTNAYDAKWNVKWTAQAEYEIPATAIGANSCFAAHATTPYLFIGTGNKLQALNLDALSQGSAALNLISTYDGDITAISHSYSSLKGINELAIALKTTDTEYPGSFLLINPTLTAGGTVIMRVDKVGGIIKDLVRKIQ